MTQIREVLIEILFLEEYYFFDEMGGVGFVVSQDFKSSEAGGTATKLGLGNYYWNLLLYNSLQTGTQYIGTNAGK